MTVAEILNHFPKISVLVVGDICLDRWCTYDPLASEPSAETGIPRIGVVRTDVTAGAGGTVANNLAALGTGRVAVLGAIGMDGFGHELSRALGARGIDSNLCVRSEVIQTFTYTKLINAQSGVEDLPRVDFINTAPLDAGVERDILDRLQLAIDAHDVIIVSDQAETARGGLVTAGVREMLADLAPNYPEKVFWVDSRRRIHLFRNVALKPNRSEAVAACRDAFGREDYSKLRAHTNAPVLMVTHGPDGVAIITPDSERWVPTRSVPNPVDICGAGDSFSAGAALALRVTRSPEKAAQFGNLVASVTIMKKGTGTASPQEVLAADENARA